VHSRPVTWSCTHEILRTVPLGATPEIGAPRAVTWRSGQSSVPTICLGSSSINWRTFTPYGRKSSPGSTRVLCGLVCMVPKPGADGVRSRQTFSAINIFRIKLNLRYCVTYGMQYLRYRSQCDSIRSRENGQGCIAARETIGQHKPRHGKERRGHACVGLWNGMDQHLPSHVHVQPYARWAGAVRNF
jgi:hypothetical protein